MSDSVTPGPLGEIPATTNMYTASQVDGLLDSFSELISGVTESGWKTISDIISGAENLVTEDGLKNIIYSDSSSGAIVLNSGRALDVSGVYFAKTDNPDSSTLKRLFDESMFYGAVCGVVRGVDFITEFMMNYTYTPQSLAYAIDEAHSVSRALYGPSGIPQSGDESGIRDFIYGMLSGGGYSSLAKLPQGATDFCSGVNACISGYDFVTMQQLQSFNFATASDISGVTSALNGLNSAVSSLQSATCGISATLSGMADAISGLPDAIVEAIDSSPLLTEEVKEKAKAAVLPAVHDMNQTLNQKKADLVEDLEATADALDDNDPTAVDSVSESLSEVADATEAVDLSEASEAASSGADKASSASTAAANESTLIEALPGFVP